MQGDQNNIFCKIEASTGKMYLLLSKCFSSFSFVPFLEIFLLVYFVFVYLLGVSGKTGVFQIRVGIFDCKENYTKDEDNIFRNLSVVLPSVA